MNKINLNKYISIVVGTAITGISFGIFINPNKIVGGGFSGLATVLYHAFHVPLGVTIAILNILLLGVSFKKLGVKFVKDTLIGSLSLAFFSEVFSRVPVLTHDILLATIFGAFLYGIGAGLVFSAGGTTGGSDVLARLFQINFPHFKIGTLVYMIDFLVLIASLFVFEDLNLVLLGILCIFIQAYVTNYYIHMLNVSKVAFVITEKGEELSKALLLKTERGITILESKGAYTMNTNNVLICALKENEMIQFEKYVMSMDPNAFVIYSESQQILGNGFRIYR